MAEAKKKPWIYDIDGYKVEQDHEMTDAEEAQYREILPPNVGGLPAETGQYAKMGGTIQPGKEPVILPKAGPAIEVGRILPPPEPSPKPEVLPPEAVPKSPKRPWIYEISGHRFESDHEMTSKELDDAERTINDYLARTITPPLSRVVAADAPSEALTIVPGSERTVPSTGMEDPQFMQAYEAMRKKAPAFAARTVAPIMAGAIVPGAGLLPGLVTGGTAVAGEAAARKMEGAPVTPGGLAAAGLTYGLPVSVSMSTIPRAVAAGGALAWGSSTLGSLLETGEMPTIGNQAITLLTGGLLGGFFGRTQKVSEPLVSSLKEIAPPDVAAEAENIITKGKIPNASPAMAQDIRELDRTRRNLPFLKQMFPSKTEAELADIPISYRPMLAKPRITMAGEEVSGVEFPSTFAPEMEQPALPGIPRERELVRRRISKKKPFVTKEEYRLGTYFKPTGSFFADVQTRTGIPVYDQVYRPIREGYENMNLYLARQGEEIKNVWRGRLGRRARRSREAAMDWAEATDDQRKVLEQTMSPDDIAHAKQFNDLMERQFSDSNLDWNDFIQNQLPAARAAGSAKAAFPVNVPKEMHTFENLFDSEVMSLSDRDPLNFAFHLSHKLGVEKYLGNTIKEVRRNFNERTIQDPTVRQGIEWFLDRAQGRSDMVARQLENWYMRMRAAIPVFGREISRQDARKAVAHALSLQYKGTMALRPGPLIRNTFQEFQTGLAFLGPKYFLKGFKDSLSRKAYRFAVQQGAIPADATFAAEARESMGEGTTRLGRVLDKGLSWYGTVENWNRAKAFNGMYRKASDASRRAKSAEEFIDLADLDLGFQRPDRDRIAALWASGNKQEAIRQSALAYTDMTQFMYSQIERAPALTGTTGRIGGAFGNWSSFYGDMLRRTAMSDASASKKAKALVWFLTGNSIVAGAGYGAAKIAGHDPSLSDVAEGKFLSPTVFEGGPLVEAITGTLGTAKQVLEGDISRAKREGLFSKNYPYFKPLRPFSGYYQMQDMRRLMKTLDERGIAAGAMEQTGLYRRPPLK